MDSYFATGNEYVSLPKINELSGGIEDMSFLYMSLKGMIDVRGAARPFPASLCACRASVRLRRGCSGTASAAWRPCAAPPGRS